ncbi:MAG: hypothetical protein ABEJ59_04930 [Halanaeroarchaeum sp.]
MESSLDRPHRFVDRGAESLCASVGLPPVGVVGDLVASEQGVEFEAALSDQRRLDGRQGVGERVGGIRWGRR